MPQRLFLHHNALVLDDPTENRCEDEDVLCNALPGGANSEGSLSGAEHLVRCAQIETARVANWKDISVRGVGHDRGLEISETVGVDRPTHFRGAADDLALVTGPLVGPDVADIAVFEAEGLHVRLGPGLPSCRNTAVEDGEIVGVSLVRVGFRAHAGDVVHEVGNSDELLVEIALKLRLPSDGPPLLVARSINPPRRRD